ncbi:MAG: 4Fe-4S binding protein, partial [bacterium]|nr:4Fe-4S binding protein [bacterium]
MIGFFNRLFRCGWFPLVFQLMTFAAFIFLIIIGFVADTNDMAYAKILRNTNIANLLVWSYWWPLIIISAIFLGRVWCTVCPMELVTSLASKFGFKLKFPKALKSGWVITGFYILILFIGVHTLSIHRVPYRMALYMLVLFGAAVVFGLLFSRNTFCAHVCPVGYLLGLYARLAPVGWGVKSESTCSGCKDKSCVSTKTAYEFQGRSCGVGLNPAGLDDNTECLVCGQCLKACDGNNPGLKERPNPGLKRRPWFKDIFDLKAMNAAQTFFCLVVSGFIIYEIFVEWKVSKKLLMWAPKELEKLPGFNCALGHGMVKSLTLYVVLPLLIWLVPYGLFRLMGGRLSLG